MSQPTSEPISCGSCAAPYVTPPEDHSAWFASEVHTHDSQLKSYLRGSFPSVRDVEDVVQESYLRVWRRQLAQPIKSGKAFLFQVARNLAVDRLRHDRASPIEGAIDFASESVVEERPDIAESACTHEEIELLFLAIESLPPRCREIFILRKIRGMSQKDIARKLGLSEPTVQVQASRGLQRCAQFMRGRTLSSRPAT